VLQRAGVRWSTMFDFDSIKQAIDRVWLFARAGRAAAEK
jgi:hypothetical protein